ncbi:keto-hydroxyglutarate-aldolase/keto-deoxy-phosphogluconate aldolase [compost metagenome]
MTLETAHEYVAAGAVAMGIGSALVNPQRVEAEDVEWLTAETRQWCAALNP